MDQAADLTTNRSDQFRVAVTDGSHGDTTEEVEITAPVGIPYDRASPSDEGDRRRRVDEQNVPAIKFGDFHRTHVSLQMAHEVPPGVGFAPSWTISVPTP